MSDAGEALDLDDAITDRPPPVRAFDPPSSYDAPPLPFVRAPTEPVPPRPELSRRIPEGTPIVRLDPPPRRAPRTTVPQLHTPGGINPGIVLALGVVTIVVATVWSSLWIG